MALEQVSPRKRVGLPPHVPVGHKEAACNLPLCRLGGGPVLGWRAGALAEHGTGSSGYWAEDKAPHPAPTLAFSAV